MIFVFEVISHSDVPDARVAASQASKLIWTFAEAEGPTDPQCNRSGTKAIL